VKYGVSAMKISKLRLTALHKTKIDQNPL
jgi:hypothetical protein